MSLSLLRQLFRMRLQKYSEEDKHGSDPQIDAFALEVIDEVVHTGDRLADSAELGQSVPEAVKKWRDVSNS